MPNPGFERSRRQVTSSSERRIAAEANHSADPKIRRAMESLSDRLATLEDAHTDAPMPTAAGARVVPAVQPRFTATQGQYLAFIYYYTKIHQRPPAEADLQRFFRVSPPAVHQMVVTLEARGLIERVAGKPRSITLRLSRAELPDLE